MARKILFATTNPHKAERFQAYFSPLGLSVISLVDIQEKVEVVEDGKTPEENALKKATAGFKATGLPTFGVDYWLRIEGLPKNLQPGPYVRRIFLGKGNERVDATDEEMLEYYIVKIKDLGGKTKGIWTSAIALVISPKKIFIESFARETVLTSTRSPATTPGEPLNSIQIDPKTGKYFTDLSKEEWLKLQGERERRYIGFMKKHLKDLT